MHVRAVPAKVVAWVSYPSIPRSAWDRKPRRSAARRARRKGVHNHEIRSALPGDGSVASPCLVRAAIFGSRRAARRAFPRRAWDRAVPIVHPETNHATRGAVAPPWRDSGRRRGGGPDSRGRASERVKTETQLVSSSLESQSQNGPGRPGQATAQGDPVRSRTLRPRSRTCVPVGGNVGTYWRHDAPNWKWRWVAPSLVAELSRS